MKLIKTGLSLLLILMSSQSVADDTELYVVEGTPRTGIRPQILIIFDNSNSMVNNSQPEKTFFTQAQNLSSRSKVFFSSSTSVPEPTSEQYFLHDKNRCQTSIQYLNGYGLFTGYLRDYQFVGQTGAWREMTGSNSTTITDVDCFEDISEQNTGNNSYSAGFPIDHFGTKVNPIAYSLVTSSDDSAVFEAAHESALRTHFGVGKPVHLYTQEYVEWYHNDAIAETNYQRIQIAKEVVENVLVTTPGADIGLAIFNSPSEQGGRIVSGIKQNTIETRNKLLEIVPALGTERTTPLCETLYEAYRYFSGQSVIYGDNSPLTSSPRYDESIESGGTYISPLQECQSNVYVIIVTDGFPYTDANADDDVRALPGINQDYFLITEKNNRPTLLPNLAEWLANNDVNPSLDGVQTVTTHTIGFSAAAENAQGVLSETAVSGGGLYSSAANTKELQTAITSLVNIALENGNSFTAPAIATNNFDSTRTLDSLYYAMFLPNKGPRWSGNLKKFRVKSDGTVVDQAGRAALEADGTVKATACSIWSNCTGGFDGGNVNQGGAAASITQKAAAKTRNLWSNMGSNYDSLALENLSTKLAEVASHMRTDTDGLGNLLDWLNGIDVDDENGDDSSIDIRSDVMGDPLHSKPLAINYSSSEVSQDIRILVGTNQGFMHMFKDTGAAVEESWAFMPYKLLSKVTELRANAPSGVHSVYGLDSSPVAYVERDGTSVSSAWVFFGMRRGGNAYYALNITDPDNPKFIWRKDASDWGSQSEQEHELGQTWSEPVVTKIPGHDDPVLIIGAGYDTNKDSNDEGSADKKGRGVYIIDAFTGNRIHHFGRGTVGSKTPIADLEDSIPNKVAILDADDDGVTDRIYATDTGGNVWRMDMPNETKSNWSAYKFASLSGSDSGLLNDRQFFTHASVIKTAIKNTIRDQESSEVNIQKIPYDAVVVGSGRRPSPNDTSRNNMFFVLQDRNIHKFIESEDSPIPDALTLSSLYNITSGTPSSEQERVNFSQKFGWYYDFSNQGEKVLAAATFLDEKVFVPSYSPESGGDNQCLIEGAGRYYEFDLHFGTHRLISTVKGIPDTPPIVIIDSYGDGDDTDIIPTDPDGDDGDDGTDSGSDGSGGDPDCNLIIVIPGATPIADCPEPKRLYFYSPAQCSIGANDENCQ